MTKEKLTRHVMLRIEEDTDGRVKTLAQQHGISAADLIRSAINEKLSDWEARGLFLQPTRKPRTAKATA